MTYLAVIDPQLEVDESIEVRNLVDALIGHVQLGAAFHILVILDGQLRNGSLTPLVNPNMQHLTKAQTDSIDQMKLDLVQGTTVTRYSYAVTTGVGLNFATTVSDGGKVFGRSSTFINELNDRHGEAIEPDAIHDERVGASVHQRSALRRLLTLLKGDPDTARRHLDTLGHGSEARADQPQQDVECEYIELHDFRTAFVAAGAALPANVVERI
ncbi:hypothetical protein GN244_ATG06008 [Phytophthora infestans]|uniref:Uncharacterized protein n=1 Tax=Phytophthora infestans TaxID=4787 RepID=A0A833WXU3_PHYIN|nr:hypothetical protein GN244_ATG06008 [Phytophthora infestans]KAF4135287.1 hypothetical protein GN958_ATG15475 [Phytophthora infestans]